MELIGGVFSTNLCGTPKVQLSRVRVNNYSLKLGRDCAISFVSQVVVEGVEKRRENQVGQIINHQHLVFGKGL